MKFKNIKLALFVSIVTILFLSSTLMAQENEKLIDPNIPESWFEAPKTASEAGIVDFNQSPMLEKRIEKGDLPSVKERLPVDPPVREPYNKIGEYGGTLTLWDMQHYGPELWYTNSAAGFRYNPEAEVVPNILKVVEFSDDYKEFTIHLREGVKWSDGHPFTSDDYLYWWEYYANNKDLSPASPENWDPPILDVTAEDEWTVIFHLGKAAPGFYVNTGFYANNLGPAHFMKQFHPEFVGEETVIEMAEEVGLEGWDEYYSRIQSDSPNHPEYEHQRPVLTPWRAVDRSETTLSLERNPYYPFVDSEGNQLPYIDNIRVNVATSEEMISMKATTGEASLVTRYLDAQQIPLYKKNEEKEDYKTLIYNASWGNTATYAPNLSVKDPKLRAIFHDKRFRQALSLAIDRDEINRKIFYSEAIPRQATVPSFNESFEKRFAEAYAEYNPERAKELLDDIGMVDRDGNGYREMPEKEVKLPSGEKVTLKGETFNPTMLVASIAAFQGPEIAEQIIKHWEEIGLNINMHQVSYALWSERLGANDTEMHFTACLATTAGDMFKTVTGLSWLAPIGGRTWGSPFPGYVSWYSTDGKEGLEPPQLIKDAYEYAEESLYALEKEDRIEARKNLLELQAENIWIIGTVWATPTPIIAKNNVKNIPQKRLWGIDDGKGLYPTQIYIDEN